MCFRYLYSEAAGNYNFDAGADAFFALASPKKYALCSPIRGARSARGAAASPASAQNIARK